MNEQTKQAPPDPRNPWPADGRKIEATDRADLLKQLGVGECAFLSNDGHFDNVFCGFHGRRVWTRSDTRPPECLSCEVPGNQRASGLRSVATPTELEAR